MITIIELEEMIQLYEQNIKKIKEKIRCIQEEQENESKKDALTDVSGIKVQSKTKSTNLSRQCVEVEDYNG